MQFFLNTQVIHLDLFLDILITLRFTKNIRNVFQQYSERRSVIFDMEYLKYCRNPEWLGNIFGVVLDILITI